MFIVFSYSCYLLLYLLYLVIQHFCCQSVIKIQFSCQHTFLPLFNRMSLDKLTQGSQRFTSRHDARGTEISVSDKFRTRAAERLDFYLI